MEKTTKIDAVLLDKIKEILNKKPKNYSIHNITHFVNLAVSELLEKIENDK